MAKTKFKDPVRIHYGKANLFGTGPVTLTPGNNILERELYNQVKDSPGWKARVAKGVIEVKNAEPVTPEADRTTAALTAGATQSGEGSGIPSEVLVEEIAGMNDVDMLREMAEAEDRDIAKAAQVRLAEIDAAIKNEGGAGKGTEAKKTTGAGKGTEAKK